MFERNKLQNGPAAPRGSTDMLISGEEAASDIRNMYSTDQGTLRAVWGPVEYHPADYVNNGGNSVAPTVYATPHLGVHHARIEGGSRDLLLAHFGDQIYVHEGWSVDWRSVLSVSSAFSLVNTPLPENDERAGFLTQFVSTPTGVVIIPQGARAYFYNGGTAVPLGYDRAPGAPTPHGPRSNTSSAAGANYTDQANEAGYAHSGRNMNVSFGNGYLGSVRHFTALNDTGGGTSNPLGGNLEEGEWRALTQWIDIHGNLSPVSGPSAPATVSPEENVSQGRRQAEPENADKMRVQIAWTGIDEGPPHTAGRILGRTQDLRQSGIPGFFEVPDYSTNGAFSFATLPGNTGTFYPDNIPDSWLITPITQVDAVPVFRVATMAFGSLWIANTADEPGMLRPSLAGRWGTFPQGNKFYPDATGAAITGLVACHAGLLAFTETSTFLLVENDLGNGYRVGTVSASAGCVSPDSIATLPNGMVVWMGREGFYGFDGDAVQLLSVDIQERFNRVNRSLWARACAAVDPRSGEYRCWVATDGASTNNYCFVYDGRGWRSRDKEAVSAVCVSEDHRRLMLGLGSTTVYNTGSQQEENHASLYVLDHDGLGYRTAVDTVASFETNWLRAARSGNRASPVRATLWLRESRKGSLNVEVYRDWRLTNVEEVPPEAITYAQADPPPFWGETALNTEVEDKLRRTEGPPKWVRRRPYWVKVDFSVRDAETFKLKITGTGDWEFVGIAYQETPSHKGGSSIQGRR